MQGRGVSGFVHQRRHLLKDALCLVNPPLISGQIAALEGRVCVNEGSVGLGDQLLECGIIASIWWGGGLIALDVWESKHQLQSAIE